MSKDELIHNLSLLEHLRMYGQEALIEADKIQYMSNDGEWESFENLGLSKIPIIIYAKRCFDKKDAKMIYELVYRLMIPMVKIKPYYVEQIELEKDHQTGEGYLRSYYAKVNENDDDAVVKYDNSNINTFSRTEGLNSVLSFDSKDLYKLYDVADTIRKSVTLSKRRKK